MVTVITNTHQYQLTLLIVLIRKLKKAIWYGKLSETNCLDVEGVDCSVDDAGDHASVIGLTVPLFLILLL